MINVNEYIEIILKKKKWTKARLCKEINIVEAGLGEKRTTRQNITNYLNYCHDMRPKWLVKVEYALDLPPNSLVSMVSPPATKEAQKEIKELMKKVREVKK